MRIKHFITDCVSARGCDIEDMVDNARDITVETFKKHIGLENFRDLEDRFGRCPRLQDDYAVSFSKSKYRGRECVYMTHSCIEYVFV